MKLVTVRLTDSQLSRAIKQMCRSAMFLSLPLPPSLLLPHILGGSELHCETIPFHYIAGYCLPACWLSQKYQLLDLVLAVGTLRLLIVKII